MRVSHREMEEEIDRLTEREREGGGGESNSLRQNHSDVLAGW